MTGHELRYQNGFDCQGLWVEVEVEKELGYGTKQEVVEHGIDKFVNECKKRVLRFAARQTEQSIRLGYWMEWDTPTNCESWHGSRYGCRVGHRRHHPASRTRQTKRTIVAQLGSPESVEVTSHFRPKTTRRSGHSSRSALSVVKSIVATTSCPGRAGRKAPTARWKSPMAVS